MSFRNSEHDVTHDPFDPESEKFITDGTQATVQEPVLNESATDKRRRYMSNGGKFSDSEAHRAAALIYATVEVAEALAAQTVAIAAQSLILERQASATETLAAQAHFENIIRFYSANASGAFPEGVADQIRAHLNIAVQPINENTFG